MDREMNQHEKLYRSTGRALIVLVALWIAAMVLAVVAPPRLGNSDVAFVVLATIVAILFLAAIVLGVVRIVSYIRWTGKYPYHFLFRKSQGRGARRDNGQP